MPYGPSESIELLVEELEFTSDWYPSEFSAALTVTYTPPEEEPPPPSPDPGSQKKLVISGSRWSPRHIPGLEGTFTYNGLVLNDRQQLEHYRITKITGLRDFPDFRQMESELAEQVGGAHFDGFPRGRTIQLEGFINAYSMSKLRRMQRDLSDAFVTLTEQPLLLESEFTIPKVIFCRKAGRIMMKDDWSTARQKHTMPFQITLKASDPRIHAQEWTFSQLVVLDNLGTNAINTTTWGNFYADTIIRLGDIDSLGSWSLTNPMIRSTIQPTMVGYSGVLSGGSGTWFDIEPWRGTVKTQAGAISITKDWSVDISSAISAALHGMIFTRADSLNSVTPLGSLSFQNSGKTGTPKAQIIHRDAWL